jgi:N-methylhydantoinase B
MSTTEAQARADARAPVDGVRLAVLANRFEAIARSMMNTLVRTGRSGVLNTGQDFSCAIFTPAHELLAVAESQPVHVLSGDLMTRAMVEFHPELAGGTRFCTTRLSRQLACSRSHDPRAGSGR